MKTQNHNKLIALMLLIFVGQVFSAPIFSCSQHQESQSSMMMDMDMHMDSMDSSEMDSMSMDCCGDQCDCPDAMCFSHVFISSINSVSSYDTPKGCLTISKQIFVQEHLVSAIFHPPILS